MAVIARNFGAKIIKNVGDCLILCYPRTSDTSNKHFVNINSSHYNTAIILLARSLEGERRLHFSLG